MASLDIRERSILGFVGKSRTSRVRGVRLDRGRRNPRERETRPGWGRLVVLHSQDQPGPTRMSILARDAHSVRLKLTCVDLGVQQLNRSMRKFERERKVARRHALRRRTRVARLASYNIANQPRGRTAGALRVGCGRSFDIGSFGAKVTPNRTGLGHEITTYLGFRNRRNERRHRPAGAEPGAAEPLSAAVVAPGDSCCAVWLGCGGFATRGARTRACSAV